MSGKVIYSARLLEENTDLSKHIPGSNLIYLHDVEPRKRKIWDKRYEIYRDYNERMALFRCKLCGNEFVTDLSGPLSGTCKSCGCKNIVYKDPEPGERFGHLTVIENFYKMEKNFHKKYNKYYEQKVRVVKCKCDCGNETTVDLRDLMIGNATSCGECYNPNLKNSYKPEIKERCFKLGKIYDKMKSRVLRPDSDTNAVNYALRGIELRITLDRFMELYYLDPDWSPDNNLQIDRIDNDGHYEEGNLRWVSKDDNNLNRVVSDTFSVAKVSDRLMTEATFVKYSNNTVVAPNDFYKVEFPLKSKSNKSYFLFVVKDLGYKSKTVDHIKRFINYAYKLYQTQTNKRFKFRLGVFSKLTNSEIDIDKISNWDNTHYEIRKIYDFK